MLDDFDEYKGQSGLDSPAQDAEEITPNDTADLSHATRALYVGADGDVRVTFIAGATVTLAGLRAGVAYPLRLARVHASGTTAAGLVGLR